MARTLKAAVIGECMIELGRQNGAITQTYGGDTLNTAVYMHRASKGQIDYITAVGKNDPYSQGMLEFMQANKIGCGLVQRLEGKLPGIYAIDLDHNGERHFSYWRGEAAAKDCFEHPDSETILATLWSYDLAHFSGITLAILKDHGRDKLLNALEKAAARGVKISFDFNFRPELWQIDPAPYFRRAAKIASWAFLSPPELQALGTEVPALWSDAMTEALKSLGAKEIILRNGAEKGAVYRLDNDMPVLFEPEAKLRPVDTTAAGDAFTGAYLAAAMTGKSISECIKAGQKMAEAVIMHPGAIIPENLTPAV